jgi:hypothetical protein
LQLRASVMPQRQRDKRAAIRLLVQCLKNSGLETDVTKKSIQIRIPSGGDISHASYYCRNFPLHMSVSHRNAEYN